MDDDRDLEAVRGHTGGRVHVEKARGALETTADLARFGGIRDVEGDLEGRVAGQRCGALHGRDRSEALDARPRSKCIRARLRGARREPRHENAQPGDECVHPGSPPLVGG